MNHQQNKFKRDNSFLSEKGEKAYKQYMEYWEVRRGFPSAAIDEISANLHQQIIFHEFSKNEKSAKMLFDQTNLRVLYLTDNIEDIYGYTAAEIVEMGVLLFFDNLAPEHLSAPLAVTQIYMNNCETIPLEIYTSNMKLTYCGMKFKHKDQNFRRMMLRCVPLEIDEYGMIRVCIVTIEDVTHLMKSDFCWGRFSFGKKEEYQQHFLSNVGEKQTRDIISNREKDVLRLIAQGFESKEIANQLFISSGTVDMHRRNMIARTGARDTTALLQLCISCGII